ncbi:hypothetical protein [Leucobacter denitrificans]|uniref:Uncharacterized protein n=1 Tax=Leucobacter denitrificans TaxID=683042 RepID=A0A7G9S695_9MICO|nr:hypothetical protein [Leucobacter denitrificans]QNN63370.1 hypothetical protein H9L06_03335 [Leucobacter denitrificans]
MNEQSENPAQNEPRPDPMKMINQPALQQSKGTIWIVMGGLFMLMSVIPFGALVFLGSGRSAPLALTVGIVVIALYVAMLVVRFTVDQQKLRLRVLAICMLSMAGIALIGIWVCSLIENAGAASVA